MIIRACNSSGGKRIEGACRELVLQSQSAFERRFLASLHRAVLCGGTVTVSPVGRDTLAVGFGENLKDEADE